MTASRRREALTRLGCPLVECDMCKSAMKQPPDPFEGPNVIWVKRKDAPHLPDNLPSGCILLFVCSPQCHEWKRFEQEERARTDRAAQARNER